MSAWLPLIPEFIVALTLMLVLIADFSFRGKLQRLLAPGLACLGLVSALASAWLIPAGNFNQVFLYDMLAWYLKNIILAAALLVMLLSWDFERVWHRPQGEFFVLLLAATLGMMFLVSGHELILLYVGLELATFPLVLMTSYQSTDAKSAEGGLKYLILAAVGSAFLLFGFSLIYMQAGVTDIRLLADKLKDLGSQPILVAGLMAVLSGVGLKIAMVPFHMWAPDAYEGAPTPATAFLSVASKAAGFALAIRLLASAFIALRPEWRTVLMILSAATMTLGNFAAIPQTNIKRMMAYSSIAQAGYVLMGLVAFDKIGIASLLYYLAAYLPTNLAAFAVVIAVERFRGSTEISAYQGLAQQSPRLALIMLLALLSLAGIPPLAGFTAKFYLFAAVFSQGLVWLVVLAVLNSALSLYYYLRVIRVIYILPPEDSLWTMKAAFPVPLTIVLFMTLLGIIALGVYPAPWVDWANLAAQTLF